MTQKYNVAVVGATGLVGTAMLEILEERGFPINELFLLASERSAGEQIEFKGQTYTVQDLKNFDFSQVQIALFSAGGKVSEEFAPCAAAAGCVVIDNTSRFRYEEDIPLVIPEVNPEAIGDYRNRHIIANPNCSTIQMLVALKPIYDLVGIERINVATYQAVSGGGRKVLNELAEQTVSLLNGKEVEVNHYPKQLAFNVVPQVDVFLENGYTKEEMKMVWETHKILRDSSILVNPTAVRVPVFYGHSEAIHIETRSPIAVEEVQQVLANAPGVVVMEYPTAATDAAGQDAVFVGRIRKDISHPNGLNLWVVSDNIRKGAALNSIQIAERLIQDWFN